MYAVGGKDGAGPAFLDISNVAEAEPFDLSQVRLLPGIFKTNQESDEKFLLSLDPDRLLYSFRVTANLPARGKPYGGWEAPNDGIRGHFVGHYLSACAEMYAATGKQAFKDRGTLIVTELRKCQDALGTGYLSAFPATAFDEIETQSSRGNSAPYYAIHKIMAGLLDQYHYCGNEQALAMVCKMADYFQGRMARLTPDQIEKALYTSNKGPLKRHEFGGMSETLHNLYAVTNKPEYLSLGDLFDRDWFLDPLAEGKDELAGLHANTHIPQVVGFARHYELTGDDKYRRASENFWTEVTGHHSYATGSDSRGEVFLEPNVEAYGLGDDTAETCNVYNMLKLTEHLFTWNPNVGAADYAERALYNHILSSIDPDSGGMTYYLSLKPGHFKLYGAPEAFWCCIGTGVENHAKYGGEIYYHNSGTLWVNLFVPSVLSWKEKGMSLLQSTKYPESDETAFTFTVEKPIRLRLLLRDPCWAGQGASVIVNGQEQNISAQPGSYIAIDRTWKSGDKVTLRLPMSLHLHQSNDDPHSVAIMYGPVVLAGDLGREGMPPSDESTNWRDYFKIPDPTVPSLAGDAGHLDAWIRPVPGKPLNFTTMNAGNPNDVQLKPLYDIHHDRYSVYWHYLDTARPE